MRKPEQKAWDTLAPELRKCIAFRPRVNRVENVAMVGMPDVSCCGNAKEFWLELKVVESVPTRPTTPLLGNSHGLSQDQMNWHLSQRQAGGDSYIYIECPAYRILVRGELADEVNSASLGRLLAISIWNCRRPTKAPVWQELRDVLYG